MMRADLIVREGRVLDVDAMGCWVEFDPAHCAGCGAACGLTPVHRGLLRLDPLDALGVGSTVHVGVPAAGLALVAWLLLGVPALSLVAVPAVHRLLDPTAGDGLLALSGIASCVVAFLIGGIAVVTRGAAGWRPRIVHAGPHHDC